MYKIREWNTYAAALIYIIEHIIDNLLQIYSRKYDIKLVSILYRNVALLWSCRAVCRQTVPPWLALDAFGPIGEHNAALRLGI
jgi:hypothetical protein